jgi:hypothetical protein
VNLPAPLSRPLCSKLCGGDVRGKQIWPFCSSVLHITSIATKIQEYTLASSSSGSLEVGYLASWPQYPLSLAHGR